MENNVSCRTCILAAIHNVELAKTTYDKTEYTIFELMLFINELEQVVKELKAWIMRQ